MMNVCRSPAIEYMCTKFGVDSSSHFSFRMRMTHTATDATCHLTHASATATMGNEKFEATDKILSISPKNTHGSIHSFHFQGRDAAI